MKRLKYLTWRVAILCAAVMIAAAAASPAKAEVFEQYEVEAVFLYNLTNFIIWPAKPDRNESAKFVMGVLGHGNRLGTLLEHAVAGEKTKGLSIEVKHFRSLDEIESYPCDLLFIDREQMHLWPQIRKIARRFKILTVSDVAGFGQRGGMVGLLTSGRKIRIEINLEEARRNGFEISAKLLKLAHIVTYGKSD